MKRSITTALGMTVAVALALSACGSDDSASSDEGTTTDETGEATEVDDEPVTITLAAWSLDTTPEFQTLADGFAAENPGVTVELVEYAAGDEYDTQMIADLAAGTAPDVYVLKNLQHFHTYQSGAQLLDVSDVAAGLDPDTGGVDFYTADGANYAVPYRQDSWVLFYNQDLFDEAGVDAPDGSWTWDDYVDSAKAVTAGLEDDRKGTYQHSWQSVVQGFALAQSGAELTGGDYGYLAPFYERALDLQDSGAQESFGTVTTNSLSYQSQFGLQHAAMLPMGTWYVATLVTQQGNGEADEFAWGMAPIPQVDASTAGTDTTPVTFGDPTGLGINPAIDENKVEVAKEFLAYAAGEGGAAALAGIGITPALLSDGVVDTYFALEGVPTDELSQFAFSTHDTRPENPVSEHTAVVQNILGDAHSAIMSESESITDAIGGAESRAANEAGLG